MTSKSLALRGLYPATVTPFAEDFSLDIPALRKHLRTVASTPGVKGIVVNGGVGEILQLSLDEQVQIVREAAAAVAPDQIVVAGISNSSAKRAAADARALKAAGAQALLVLPPFDVRAYNRLRGHTPSIVAYFRELGEAGVPMIVFLYSPASGCAYSLDALKALADVPGVVGIKAACGTLDVYRPIWDALKDKVSVLAAVDGPDLPDFLAYGAHGALIGISTVGTPMWVELLEAAARGEGARVKALMKRCAPIMESVWENHHFKRPTSEVASHKEALVQLGQLPSSRVRAPSIGVTPEVREEIRAGLLASGLLEEKMAMAK
ncbi:MAG: dihydrodipicolinate synthase family protein [Burkholderiaceae bacterium]|nr:dihydrodipicolinate synthase family protein [Burkholderiaceae bacterium]